MTTQHNQLLNTPSIMLLDKRFEDIAWGVFLLLIGSLLILPGELVPRGTWLIGAGLIMLGLNALRYFNHIRTSTLTVGLGVISVLLGLATFFGLRLPLFALFLIVIGVSIIFKALLPSRI